MKSSPFIKNALKELMLLKYLERGYCIAKETPEHYRIWNRSERLYLILFDTDWRIGKINSYGSKQSWIWGPKAAIDFITGAEMEMLIEKMNEKIQKGKIDINNEIG